MIKIQYTGAADYGQYVTALVAGPPGRGKTRFVVTAKDPFLLNAEAGTMSIADQHIPSTPIESLDDLYQIRNLLSLGTEKVEEILGVRVGTVILDTFDEVQRLMIRERLTREQKDYMQVGDWTWLNDQLNAIVRGFRSLDMHVIFTCHIKDQQEGNTGAISHKLDLSGGIAHQLPAAVDLAMLLDSRSVLEEGENGESTKVNKTLLFTEPMEKFPWIKDRSGKLDPVIELNFEDDFQQMVSTIYNVKLEEGESREVEFQMPEEEVEEVEEQSTEDKIAEADKKVAAAKKAKGSAKKADNKKEPKKERAELAGPGDRSKEASGVELSEHDNGDMIILEGHEIPIGFQLGKDGKGIQVKGARFVYTVGKEKVLSRNQLESGIVPAPNGEINSGLFCQASGVEVLPEDANISRIRLGQVLSDAEFEKRAR